MQENKSLVKKQSQSEFINIGRKYQSMFFYLFVFQLQQ